MSSTSGVIEQIKQSIIEGDDVAAKAAAEKALAEGLAPVDILNSGIVPGIETTGQLRADGQYFMPDVILGAEAFKAASSVIEPRLKAGDAHKAGKVVLGVVAGDMHNLGITIVAAMLRGAGFEVQELGIDVPVATFIAKAKDGDVDIVGMGAYMTTTMLVMKDVIEGLKKEKLRGKVKVMVGGVPLSQEYADEIGADAWGKDALDAVVKAKQVMGVS